MPKYRVILTWNNRRVLEGEASAVVTWNNIRHLMIDDFAGDTRKLGDERSPTLVDLMNAEIGQRFANGVSDETGAATFIVERIE